MAPTYRIALYDHYQDAIPKPIEVSWEDLCGELAQVDPTECDPCPGHDCPLKMGKAWSPVDFADGAQSRSVGRAVTLAVFDLDKPTEAQQEALAQRLQGYRFALHSTHAGDSYRLVIPLEAPVPAARWPEAWRRLVAWLGIEQVTPASPHGIDPQCKDVARIYFFPSCAKSHVSAFEFVSQDGAVLAVEEATSLDRQLFDGDGKVEGLKHSLPDPEAPVDIAAARRDLKAVKRAASAALIKRMFNGESLAVKGERDNNVHALASIVAATPKTALPVAAAIQLMRPCIAAMALEPEGLEGWLAKAQFSYERALERRAARDAQEAHTKDTMARLLGRRDTPAPSAEDPPAEDDEWRQLLLVKVDRDGAPVGLQPAGVNAGLILDHAPEFKDKIKFNLLSKEIEIDGYLPATAPIEISNYLALSDYRLSLPTPWVGEQLLAVSRHHDYNPVSDYLRSLKWDGKERVSGFLWQYFRAAGDGSDKHAQHINRVGRKWLLGLVARGLQPGCFVKNILILHGAQNIGKSLALRALGGRWYSDTKLNVHDKDARLAASRFWLIELAELTALRQADNETLKNFLSQVDDDYRPPYGHSIEKFLRSCVFVGSTNLDDFLTDPTGSTRYWPVHVETPDYNAIARDRDQILAEAVGYFDAGEKWWLDKKETDIAEEYAGDFARVIPKIEPIMAWLLEKSPEARREFYTIQEIATEGLGFLRGQVQHSAMVEIGIALKSLGFERVRKRVEGVPVVMYKTPATILQMHRERIRPLRSKALADTPLPAKEP